MRVAILALFACIACGQEFEVASIRPSAPVAADRPVRRGMGLQNGQFTGSGVTVRMLIENAYQLLPFQLTGLPDWAESDRFDIRAVATGAETNEQTRPMIRKLLADRFGLKMRRESKERDTYALLTRGETKLTPTATPGRAMLRVTVGSGENLNVKNEFQATTMARLADQLARETERMVTDETGLAGEYDFTLQSEREPGAVSRFASPIAPLIGSLGLRLESRKGMVETYAVESVERPTEN